MISEIERLSNEKTHECEGSKTTVVQSEMILGSSIL